MEHPVKKLRRDALESHPMLDRIIGALMKGDSLESIRVWAYPTPSRNSLFRFKKNRMARVIEAKAGAPRAMATALQEKGLLPDCAEVDQVVAATAGAIAMADPLLSQMSKHQHIINEVLDDPNVKPVAKMDAIRTDLKRVEMWAKLTGRLEKTSGSGVRIEIVNPQPTSKVNILVPVVEIGS